eukprot:scaffold102666_cov32-Tisochrysis_lutea.AAC.3
MTELLLNIIVPVFLIALCVVVALSVALDFVLLRALTPLLRLLINFPTLSKAKARPTPTKDNPPQHTEDTLSGGDKCDPQPTTQRNQRELTKKTNTYMQVKQQLATHQRQAGQRPRAGDARATERGRAGRRVAEPEDDECRRELHDARARTLAP